MVDVKEGERAAHIYSTCRPEPVDAAASGRVQRAIRHVQPVLTRFVIASRRYLYLSLQCCVYMCRNA